MNKTQRKPYKQSNETQANPQKNQMKPTTQSLYGFKFSRNREIERLKKKRKVEGDQPVLS